jgi:hypothetical protein
MSIIHFSHALSNISIGQGAHNDVVDGSRAIIVSSQQFTCVDRRSNKNDRTRPGLFACG